MGRRRIHKRYRKGTDPQVHTSLIIDEAIWNLARHLAVDEKKSVGMVLEEALRLLLKLKDRLPPDEELSPELEKLLEE